MLKEVIEAHAAGDHLLFVRFKDGVEGTADLSERLEFKGVFTSLRDPEEFAKVRVDPELGTVVWPGGADLDPVVLYSLVTGTPIDVNTAPEDSTP